MTILRKAAVFGAGSMGGGIAAQFANADIPVLLLDRDISTARAGIARQLASGGFMHAAAANLVTPASAETDIEQVREADWIVEAIIEDPAAKRALYTRLQGLRADHAIVSSNTSTLARASLLDGLDPSFRQHFLITHFFNPPRQMPLMELVSGAETSAQARALAAEGGATLLGKTVVAAKDTPGFIANRLGCYWIGAGVVEALQAGIALEHADAAMSRAFTAPRTGVFNLLDLIGLDLVPLVWGSLARALPADDGIHHYDISQHPLIAALQSAGRLGRKTKAGFYRQDKETGLQALDLPGLDYRPVDKTEMQDSRELDAYAWRVFSRVFRYTCEVAADIADDVAAIDAAMTLGYGWKQGPFALADSYGIKALAQRYTEAGESVPALLRAALEHGGFYQPVSFLTAAGQRVAAPAPTGLALARPRGAPVLRQDSAELWDVGDGIACLSLNTKMNVLDSQVFELIHNTIERLPRDFQGLVIGNDHARAFSAGADLRFILQCIDGKNEHALRDFVAAGQAAMQALRFARFPVVAAMHGLALGGGCELALHCDAIVAAAESQAGLPESKVGIIPAWGGCVQLLRRAQALPPKGPLASARRVFDVIAAGAVSGSALEAKDMGILQSSDVILMNRAQVFEAARQRCLSLARDYRAPDAQMLTLAGASGRLSLAHAIEAERVAGRKTAASSELELMLAGVLTAGEPGTPVSELALYALEREAMIALTRLPATRARVDHMLRTGKPLKN